MKFKNDKERIAFLEERRHDQGWYLWREDKTTDRRMWRFDTKESSIVVEEHRQTLRYPHTHIKWMVAGWYIVRELGTVPFEDWRASRTLALQEIKRCEKEGLC